MSKYIRIVFIVFILVIPLSGFQSGLQQNQDIYVIDDATFEDVNAGLELGGPLKAIDVLQRALKTKNSGWNQYTWEDLNGNDRDISYYIWNVSNAQMIGVNPRILLVTVGVSLDWQIPEDQELRTAVDKIGVALADYYREFKFNEDIQNRYPDMSNAATYALYAYFDYDLEKINTWEAAYQELFGSEATTQMALSTDFSFPDPFITKPIRQPAEPTPFYTFHSLLDHQWPYRYEENTLSRFDGKKFSGTLDECDAGKSCYSGHEGYDYDTGRDYPGTTPGIYAVADGTVTRIRENCGQVEISHEDEKIVSVYMHMDDIQVSVDDPISVGEILGYTGNVADGTTCKSTGAHLHFHMYHQEARSAFIDPFGWWDEDGNVDPLENTTDRGNPGSAWLWRGDEAGDGYLTVDNTEAQAHLFHQPNDRESGQTWWYDSSGYQGGSWWTYSVVEETNSTNWAIWGTDIEASGTYCVSARWPRHDENTDSASYKIFNETQGLIDTVIMNQRVEGNGWVNLGEHTLEAGPSVVILTDFVGSEGETQKRVYFDAVRWEQGSCVEPSPTTPPPPTGTPTPPPGYSTIKVQVKQGVEDAGIEPYGCSFNTYMNEIYIGECDNGSLITSGFRFGDVPIPKGVDIWEAYLEFTVDGRYDIPVSVRINGEKSGNAQTFSVSNQPSVRPTTIAMATWDIPASDVWELGYIRRSPELKDVVREIISLPDWEPYNGMAFIFDSLSSAEGRHRRVIGYERPVWYPGSEHAARLIVTFKGTPLPTSTPPTPTTPAPTPTPPPSPSETPEPICIFRGFFNLFSSQALLQNNAPLVTGTPTANTLSLAQKLNTTADLVEFAPLLYSVRDELLSETKQGQHYIDLYQEHTTEIAIILIQTDLYYQGYDVLKSLEPNLQALLDGEGDTVTITAEQVREVQEFLVALSGEASPELEAAIQAERERRPLDELIGLTMDEAWDFVNGYNLTWLPPVSEKDPLEIAAGRTIPVQFRIETDEDEFVADHTVILQLVNEDGEVILGPITAGQNPTKGIMIQDEKYHFKLKTKGLSPGLYKIEIYFNAKDPNEPEVWDLWLKEKRN